jgi:large subunit ribosomal protein L6
MSRIGRKPIAVPANVKIEIKDQVVAVQGPKGKQQVNVPAGIQLRQENGQLLADRKNDSYAALHGLVRSLVANAVTGVSAGFQKELDIVGTGYRAEMKGKNFLVLSLGFSHLIEYPVPPGIEISVDAKQTHVVVAGSDRQRVGQVAAELRALRPPDPYKNKGVRYTGERLRKKVGKTGGK